MLKAPEAAGPQACNNPSRSRSGTGRTGRVHPRKTTLGRAMLDKNRAIRIPLERGGIYIADIKIVQAVRIGILTVIDPSTLRREYACRTAP